MHAFIKSHMLCDLDGMGFSVIPKDIFIGVGYETKEDPFLGIWYQLGSSLPWWADPDPATERPQSRKVILLPTQW